MERWNILLGAHNSVLADRGWTVAVRLEVCKLLKQKMLALGPLKPLPFPAENIIGLILEKHTSAK